MARAQHKLQELSVSLGVALLMISALGANAAEPREETGFGSNPGNLRMFSYVPANQEPAAPLIVVLHGCKQKAITFASDAGWLALADRSRLALLLPEQKGLPSYFYDVYLFPWFVALWGANNQNACFNWFQPKDTARDRGEALSIRQMIDAMIARHSVDRSRVYVVGLSAGGAMAAAMLAAYPERFAGGAIVAGVPYGCANTVDEALRVSRPPYCVDAENRPMLLACLR
jgi:poly(hydroxyalkanoate) depolymerase family esterase